MEKAKSMLKDDAPAGMAFSAVQDSINSLVAEKIVFYSKILTEDSPQIFLGDGQFGKYEAGYIKNT